MEWGPGEYVPTSTQPPTAEGIARVTLAPASQMPDGIDTGALLS